MNASTIPDPSTPLRDDSGENELIALAQNGQGKDIAIIKEAQPFSSSIRVKGEHYDYCHTNNAQRQIIYVKRAPSRRAPVNERSPRTA